MPKVVKSNIIKQVQALFDDYDKNPNWTRRDIFMATTLKKYTKNQYGEIALIIGDWYANNNDTNFDHGSIAMDIVAMLAFFEGDLDGVEMLLQDIPAHPKSNFRALIADAVMSCKHGLSNVKDFRDSFTGVGEK